VKHWRARQVCGSNPPPPAVGGILTGISAGPGDPTQAKLQFDAGTIFTGVVTIALTMNSDIGATTWSYVTQDNIAKTVDLQADDGGNFTGGQAYTMTANTNVSPHIVPQSGTST
jgi:hypothetical protein